MLELHAHAGPSARRLVSISDLRQSAPLTHFARPSLAGKMQARLPHRATTCMALTVAASLATDRNDTTELRNLSVQRVPCLSVGSCSQPRSLLLNHHLSPDTSSVQAESLGNCGALLACSLHDGILDGALVPSGEIYGETA